MKIIYFMCIDTLKDHVASNVLEQLRQLVELEELPTVTDGYAHYRYQSQSDQYIFVRTNHLLCANQRRYHAVISHYSDADLIGFINWHGGTHAPDHILTVHTVGDVATATFTPSKPQLTTRLIRKMEEMRRAADLTDFRVMSEATHWSGIVYGLSVDDLRLVKTAMVDIEIGSSDDAYQDIRAGRVIAQSIIDLADDKQSYPVALYVGGSHFESTISDAIIRQEAPLTLTHILASNQLQNDAYRTEDGVANLKRCIATIDGGIDAIIMHEKLKGPTKQLLRTLSDDLSVPLIKRKQIKDPSNIMPWSHQ